MFHLYLKGYNKYEVIHGMLGVLSMCTSIALQSKEKTSYFARTQDFNILLDDYIGIQIPRNYLIEASSYHFSARYSMIGLSALVEGEPLLSIPDGVNEFGLGGSTQRFSEYHNYSTEDEIVANKKTPLKSGHFLLWVLSQCKDTYEVEEKIKEVAIVDKATFGEGEGEPRHFLFTDQTGRSIVVEPSEKMGFKVYENRIGVMTNSPDFSSHLSFLSNFTGLSNVDPTPKIMKGFTLESTGKGLGFLGMPGDYTSMSRFVRIAYLNYFSEPLSDKETISQAFHLLSSVNIAKGAIKLEDEPAEESLLYSQYQIVYDLKHLSLYLKLYHNHRLQKINLCPEIAKGTKIRTYQFIQEEDILEVTVDE